MKEILVISAHPDDLEMSCGGSVAKWVSSGDRVTNLIMFSDVKHLRFLRMASRHLGHKTVLFPGTRDTIVDHKTISKIEEILDISSFDRIITHWKEDWHQDHKACHDIGNILARKQLAELWYMSSHPYHLKYSEFSADMYVNTEEFSFLKARSMSEYPNIAKQWRRGVGHHDQWRGSMIDKKTAEVFLIGNMVS